MVANGTNKPLSGTLTVVWEPINLFVNGTIGSCGEANYVYGSNTMSWSVAVPPGVTIERCFFFIPNRESLGKEITFNITLTGDFPAVTDSAKFIIVEPNYHNPPE